MQMPFKLNKKHRMIAVILFLAFIALSYQKTGLIWGTSYTIIAWSIPVLLNINNWWYKKINA